MRSFRIVLEYTDASGYAKRTAPQPLRTAPQLWDWHALVAAESDETVSVVSVEEIPTPEGHKEDLADV